jgi:hypothetical protein
VESVRTRLRSVRRPDLSRIAISPHSASTSWLFGRRRRRGGGGAGGRRRRAPGRLSGEGRRRNILRTQAGSPELGWRCAGVSGLPAGGRRSFAAGGFGHRRQ